jgi:hypothetical protein
MSHPAPLPAPANDPFATAVHQACYAEIMPHLQVLQSTQDPQQALALMEPFYYRRFADNAHRGMASLAIGVIAQIFADHASGPAGNHPAVQQLRPGYNLESDVRSRLIPCADSFQRSLAAFEQLLLLFRQKLQTAGQRAENQGAGWGTLGLVIGSVLLGPVGAAAGAVAAGYYGGSLVEQEIQRDAEQVQQSFDAMLGEYDNMTDRMADTVGQVIAGYSQAIESAVKAAGPTRARHVPVNPGVAGPTRVASQPTQQRPGATAAHAAPRAAQPRLVVLRGVIPGAWYPLAEGSTIVGRDADRVDINLTEQESAANSMTSRQHALILCQNGSLFIQDLKSRNGTFVNRMRVEPGQTWPLQANDVIQIGGVFLKVQY